ncbi:FAD binding domain-containing protein [Daldinia grandis]|nr:FAD binding domain-containing protein [Daldinia grandis]
MLLVMIFLHLLCILASLPNLGVAGLEDICNQHWDSLRQRLSSNAIIRCGSRNIRWSEYAAPDPGIVITVGTEHDVAVIVSFASQQNVPFLVQSGANGWADTFTIGQDSVIIDVSSLKTISFNSDVTQVAFQAGITNKEMIDAAWTHNSRASTGTCNCVSVLGATLGGGLSRTQGLYGIEVDQLLSINYVDSEGKEMTVTPDSDADLWWAFTGAGANFGIVTSAVFKSYPIPQAENTAWTGILTFDQTKLEQVVDAINQLNFEPEMELDFYYSAPAPNYEPTVLALPFYVGTEDQGRRKFASILDLGPLIDDTKIVPYNTWNAAGDSFCVKGGRKPSYTAGVNIMDATAWRNIWTEYSAFVEKHAEAINSTILAECYSTQKAKEIGGQKTSYPFRDVQCQVVAIPWYVDPVLDDEANKFGRAIRSYLAPTNLSAYINFSHGDETLDAVYGSSLPRLRQLKQKYDPKGRFNQWFPLS